MLHPEEPMTDDRMALVELLQKSGDGDFLRSVAEAVLQILVEADVEGLIGAGRHERTGDRLNYRNGYRERSLDTRLGWGKSNQTRPMAEACARAKIEPPANFHALRHTYASHAVMAGAPLLVVAKNLGHADTRMVEKHYGHLSQSYIADAIRAAAPRFGTAANRHPDSNNQFRD
jgi:Phage integrase family/Transposase, Mutator family